MQAWTADWCHHAGFAVVVIKVGCKSNVDGCLGSAAAAAEYNFLLFDSGQLIPSSWNMLLQVELINKPPLINAQLLTNGAGPTETSVIKSCGQQEALFGFRNFFMQTVIQTNKPVDKG